MRGHTANDLTGQRFGRLVVTERAENKYIGKKVYVYWKCRCDCGKEKNIRGAHLKSGAVVSCGCYNTERRIARKAKHQQSKTRLYGVWCNMKNRCYNKNVRSYRNYGMNHVEVCDEWLHDFDAFSKWAFATGYDPDAEYGKCTIDRINPYGNYCPENCRWVDLKVQANNRRDNYVGEVVTGG